MRSRVSCYGSPPTREERDAILDRFRLDDQVASHQPVAAWAPDGARFRRGRRRYADRIANRVRTAGGRRANRSRWDAGRTSSSATWPTPETTAELAGKAVEVRSASRHRRQQRRRHHAQHPADHQRQGHEGRLHLQRAHRPRAHRRGRPDAGAPAAATSSTSPTMGRLRWARFPLPPAPPRRHSRTTI